MESKDLTEFEPSSPETEFRAAQIGAAFGFKEWSIDPEPFALASTMVQGRLREAPKRYGITPSGVTVEWVIFKELMAIESIDVYVPKDRCLNMVAYVNDHGHQSLKLHYDRSWYEPHKLAHHMAIMARGLYCLGIESDAMSVQLPQLTNHEKLELRLSLPREFWPQTWLDEESSQ